MLVMFHLFYIWDDMDLVQIFSQELSSPRKLRLMTGTGAVTGSSSVHFDVKL